MKIYYPRLFVYGFYKIVPTCNTQMVLMLLFITDTVTINSSSTLGLLSVSSLQLPVPFNVQCSFAIYNNKKFSTYSTFYTQKRIKIHI